MSKLDAFSDLVFEPTKPCWLWLIMLHLMASNCLSTDLSFVGSGSYSIVGNTVVLEANEILNNDFWGYSGTIRLELWAFSVPYPGTTFGYKLASYVLGQLNAGQYFYNVNSGVIPFTTPMPGSWYFSLQAREYVGTGSDGYTTCDWINFNSPVRVAGGANFGDVQIVGSTSWQVVGNYVNLSVQQVNNICDLGTSGSLRLDLWATTSPYGGGTITGYRFASYSLNPLTGGYVYNNISQTLPFVSPPAGVYYVTLTLAEYDSGSYMAVSYVNYATFLTVAGPPSPPAVYAATGVTSSGFTANWSSAAGATGYRLDVSTSSAFTSYVSGYQNLDVGNATSRSVSGLSGAKPYYYRVRAYNVVGTSANSGTTTVTTLPTPPSITAQPQSRTVTAGNSVTFAVTASGGAPLSYQWYQNNSPVTGATAASYTINTAQPNDAGEYHVRVSNPGGTVESAIAILTVTPETTPPTATITAPTANQRWSNFVFTVRGTAKDNVGVDAVWCQANGIWERALTTNGWTNWSSGVTLVPGTNVVRAFAVDTTGNKSTTNTVSLQYVVTNRLLVSATGKGTLSPNYSNSWLEIGRNYSMKATPGSGFAFTNWEVSTNWAGSATTNNATVQFMMRSNLTLQVNFADVTKPTITITSPTAGQKMTNAVANVKGTASDNWGVGSVQYQLNGGAWGLATSTNGWANWTAVLPLTAGTNVIKAYAVDLGGNASTTNSVSVTSINNFHMRLGFSSAQPMSSNGLQLSLEVASGISGRVEVSTNFKDWTMLTSFVSTNGTMQFRDSAATNYKWRFYRAVVP